MAIDPGNADLIGNLSLAYLMAGRTAEARKSIDAALRINPADQINQTISGLLREIAEGRRPQPKSLADLSKPAKRKKRRFLWFRW